MTGRQGEGSTPLDVLKTAVRLYADQPFAQKWLEDVSSRLDSGELSVDEAISEFASIVSDEERPGMLPGTQVDQFRVVSLLGRGSMGEVYLAFDTILGRKVALKVLLARAAQDAEQIVLEARATALVMHPNIVVVYEAGVFEGRPYLALELVEGRTLRRRMAGGPLSREEVARFGRDIAAALSAAHGQGLVHCDVKPENVVVGADGRARMLDFGFARRLGSRRRADGGTRGYMAPERFASLDPSPPSDVWSLGVVLFEMLTGRAPYSASDMIMLFSRQEIFPPKLPANDDVSALVLACLSLEPARRPAAAEVARRLDALLFTARDLEPDACPFPALEPFSESNAQAFFGRASEVVSVCERILSSSLTLLVGVSGTGKSSLVRAGVLPRLKRLDEWRLVELRPGPDPFGALSAALAEARFTLSSPELKSLDVALPRLVDAGQGTVIIFVDQLEELFTHVEDVSTRTAFLDLIVRTADAATNVRILATLRDDFFGRLAETALSDRLLEGVVLLRSPNRRTLVDAVREPFHLTNHRLVPPELAERIADEIIDEPSALSLLQVACAELWVRRDVTSRTVTEAMLDEFGGASGALVVHAERVLLGMTPDEVDQARAVFLKLVGPRGTRRIVLEEDLISLVEVLGRLVQRRLVLPRRMADGRQRAFELVHESLITEWPRLRGWLEASDAARVLEADLRDAAATWKRMGASVDGLWSGGTLALAEHRIEAVGPLTFTADISAFLSASRRLEAKDRRRRKLWSSFGIMVLAGVAIATTVAAVIFRDQAERIDRAAANLGAFDLEIRMYDLDPNKHEEVALVVSDFPRLSWRLLEQVGADPGSLRAVDGRLVTSSGTSVEEYVRRERVQTRGAAAVLEVSGRGRKRDCPPSRVRLNWLPGHAELEAGMELRVKLWIPSCSASLDQMLTVPGGAFISGGTGDPPSKYSEYVRPEWRIDLPAYRLDRTEVSNGAFSVFARMAEYTGIRGRRYGSDEALTRALSSSVAAAGRMTLAAAEAYCAYMGKRLPSSVEWEKAARGGLELSPGVENPAPRRNVPWEGGDALGPANVGGTSDGYRYVASVFSMPEGASPYGFLHLSGNVSEWTSSKPEGGGAGYRIVRGGDWQSPRIFEHWTVAYEGVHAEVDARLGHGVRCALDGT